MYWTQVDAEPVRQQPPQDETMVQPLQPHPYQQLSPDWQEEPAEETRLVDIFPGEEERPAYDDLAPRPGEGYRDDYRDDRYREEAELEARDRFGGVNWGAGFFGWIVTAGFAVFLATALGVVFEVTRQAVPAVGDALTGSADTSALALAGAAVVVLVLAYYAGGYVAGRMSRFDGGRQGAGVWVTGILLTALAVGVALFFGSSYDLGAKVHLPSLPTPSGSMKLLGPVAAGVAALGSLLAAIGGGKVGCRYHRKVDAYL